MRTRSRPRSRRWARAGLAAIWSSWSTRSRRAFPFTGHIEFAAVDGPGKLRLGQAGALRDTYLAKLAAHRDRIASACRRQGWTLAVHRTDRPATEALLRLATLLADGGTEVAGRF